MNIRDEIALVTGANRGLGRALVEATLEAGARKIYATARNAAQLDEVVAMAPDRVVPLRVDTTDVATLAAAAEQAADVSVLFNNAGLMSGFGVLGGRDDFARDLEVNCFGLLNATKAFLPALVRAGARGEDRAAVVNVLSVTAIASLPMLGGYGASKAAAYSLTQALRWELGARGIKVHAVLAGAIDTDMVRMFEMPKTSARDVAFAIVRDVQQGTELILPDPQSQGMYAAWRGDPAALEQQLAAASGTPQGVE